MYMNRHVVKSLERQQMKSVHRYYRSIADINMELAKLHKNIEFEIDKDHYHFATEYVNQYISYTSVWNVKFVANLENPEVALLQLFHLEYIFDHEPAHLFSNERQLFTKQKEAFIYLKSYTLDHIQMRKENMLQFIQEKKNNPTYS